jgi:hypothetical protein
MAGKNGHSLISKEKFRQLFEALIEGQRRNEDLRAASTSTGIPNSEAGPIGLTLDLRDEDTLLLPSPSHFVHGLRKPQSSFAAASVENGHKATLGNRLANAIAAAVNNRVEKNDAIVLTLFDLAEGGGGLAAYDDVFAIAEASKLAILFVLESHEGFAESAAFKERHPSFPYIAVDAHDIVAIYRVAQESIVRTREGGGPALIELAFYSAENPVEKMHRYLAAKGFPADRWRGTAISKNR